MSASKPAAAGYSGTPLARKLGIAPDMVVCALDAPPNYAALVAPLPEGARIVGRLAGGAPFAHVFVTSRAKLAARLAQCLPKLAPAGMLWVSWPKKASKVPTDVTEDAIRELALPLGLVDVKVCAVDEVWSGLKLVIRRELRADR